MSLKFDSTSLPPCGELWSLSLASLGLLNFLFAHVIKHQTFSRTFRDISSLFFCTHHLTFTLLFL